jgi:thiamine pyrophosphate-dependent acetolactate synthase large subunit-like protein
VEKPVDSRPAIQRALDARRPALVNVCTDPMAQATTNMGFAGY